MTEQKTAPKKGLHIRNATASGVRLFRVFEGNEPLGGERRATDGGGFERRGDAEALIIEVERRRQNKAERRAAEEAKNAPETEAEGEANEGAE